MIITFSSKQMSGTGNIDADLLLRQHKINLMGRFKEIESTNPKMEQMEIAKELGYFNISPLQRYRYDEKMQSPYKSHKIPKKSKKIPKHLKRLQMTSKVLK